METLVFHTKVDRYDTPTIQEIGWIHLDKDGKRTERRATIIQSLSNNISLINNALKRAGRIVAHGLHFHYECLYNELITLKAYEEAYILASMRGYCTMARSEIVLGKEKHPSLFEIIKNTTQKRHISVNSPSSEIVPVLATAYVRLVELEKKKLIQSVERKGTYPITEDGLNNEQQRIVYHEPNSTILAIAGAGSGKTRLIISRILHLIRCGVRHHTILVTTFSRDARHELQMRLYNTKVHIQTLDSLANYWVRKLYPNNVSQSELSYVFRTLLDEPEYAKMITKDKTHLFVDEVQDVNDTQFNIMKHYYNQGVKIFATGDDAQNIYTFRGADPEYILNFPKYFPDAACFSLHTNYRSTPELVRLFNSIYDKDITAVRGHGTKPTLTCYQREKTMYSDIVAYIENKYYNVQPEQICVLAKNRVILNAVEERLEHAGIRTKMLEKQEQQTACSKKGRIILSTIHKAKGLEWNTVLFVGLNDSIMPQKNDEENQANREFYVACTRARNELHLMFSEQKNSPYVSRFVSRVLHDDSNCLTINSSFSMYRNIGLSSDIQVYGNRGIEQITDNIQGDKIMQMRQRGILSDIDMQCIEIHAPFRDHLPIDHKDYGIFIDHMVCYIIDREKGTSFAPRTTRTALATIPRSETDNMTSKQVENLKKRKAKEFGLRTDDIHMIAQPFIPDIFRYRLQQHLREANQTENWQDGIESVFELSKCEKAVREKRRKMLYYRLPKNYLEDCIPLLNDIATKGIDWLKGISKELQTHVYTKDEQRNLYGEIDICVGDETIVDIKSASGERNVKTEWVLQLLGYVSLMYVVHNKIIRRLVIYNPIEGVIHNGWIGDWAATYGKMFLDIIA